MQNDQGQCKMQNWEPARERDAVDENPVFVTLFLSSLHTA